MVGVTGAAEKRRGAFTTSSDADSNIIQVMKSLVLAGDLESARREMCRWEEAGYAPSHSFSLVAVEIEARLLNEVAALDRVEQMISRGYSPELSTYSALLSMYRHLGKAEQGIAVFEDMLQRGFLPDATASTEAISLFLIALDDVGRATELLKYMLHQHMEPPSLLYTILLEYFLSKEDLTRVAELLSLFQTELHDKLSTYHYDNVSAIRDVISPILEYFGQSGRIDDLWCLYQVMLSCPALLSAPLYLSLMDLIIKHESKQHLIFQLAHHMISRARIVPTKEFCFDFAALVANQEIVTPLDYIRQCATLSEKQLSELKKQLNHNSAALVLLKYLRIDPKSDEAQTRLSAAECRQFLLDTRQLSFQFHKRRRNAVLPAVTTSETG
jgi:pentatricopeptide repeat protein